jgi:predicted aminopeptidase
MRATSWTTGIALITVFLSAGCYSVRQALHHNDLFNSRRPIMEVLADNGVDEKTKAALANVARILDFAATHGLNAENSYTYYIDTTDPHVSYLVQAAWPDRFEFRTWWFPVVGDVPYLGFFEKSERDAMAESLEKQGFDVYTAGVGAFSSLGWFDDPLFTSMLRRSETDLAHLLFHELTHRTVWIPGSVVFNENLAEYIADVMTEEYLLAIGKKPIIQAYFDKKADKKSFRIWLRSLKSELGAWYDAQKGTPQEQVIAGKKAIIDKYTGKGLRPKFKRYDYVGDDKWNNASILGASLYTPDIEVFEKAHACIGHGHLYRFLMALKLAAKQRGDGFKGLDSLCDKQKD